jgi:hypothetical protein
MTLYLTQALNKRDKEDKREISKLKQEDDSFAASMTAAQEEIKKTVQRTDHFAACMQCGLNGDLVLAIVGAAAEDITAAELNAAPAGTLTRSFDVRLGTAGGHPHDWVAFAPVVTTNEVVTDGDVLDPTVVGTPAFRKGIARVTITFDTDEGATKVYAAADSVAVQVQTKADDTLLGWPVAAVTKTYNVT